MGENHVSHFVNWNRIQHTVVHFTGTTWNFVQTSKEMCRYLQVLPNQGWIAVVHIEDKLWWRVFEATLHFKPVSNKPKWHFSIPRYESARPKKYSAYHSFSSRRHMSESPLLRRGEERIIYEQQGNISFHLWLRGSSLKEDFRCQIFITMELKRDRRKTANKVTLHLNHLPSLDIE